MTDRDIDAVVLELFHPADERGWKVALERIEISDFFLKRRIYPGMEVCADHAPSIRFKTVQIIYCLWICDDGVVCNICRHDSELVKYFLCGCLFDDGLD